MTVPANRGSAGILGSGRALPAGASITMSRLRNLQDALRAVLSDREGGLGLGAAPKDLNVFERV